MSITEKLKAAIHAYGSMYAVARDSGVSQTAVQRFVAGERDIRLATADRLAELFGLELTAKKSAKTRRSKREA